MEAIKNYEDLTLRDYFMFGKIMSDSRNRKIFLDSLMQTDLKEQEGNIEKYIHEYKDSKYVKLDLFSKDESGDIYNAEMQNKSNNNTRQKELPKRSRYYQSIIDTAYYKKGEGYLKLPDTYIIFICTFDPFGKGLPVYSFDTKCNEIELSEYDDGAHKIMFNTTADLSKLPESCRNMLQYINTGIVCDEVTQTLDDEIKEARTKHEWREEYMKTLTYLDDAYTEGHEEGYNEGREEGYNSRQEEIDNLNSEIEELKKQLAESEARAEARK